MTKQKSITQKEAAILLNYITVSGVMLNTMYQLKATSIYKHELKLKMNQVDAMLLKEKNDVVTLFDVCEEEFDSAIENCTELCQPLIKGVSPEHWQLLTFLKNAIIDYDNNKEAVEEIRAVVMKYSK